MLTNLLDEDGAPLDAKVELDDGSVVLHSRGGAFGKTNLRNPDYTKALRLILERILEGNLRPTGVWLDSRVAQSWPEQSRLILSADELQLPVESMLTMIAHRGAALGRSSDSTGRGNSTKRIRIGIQGASASQLSAQLKAAPQRQQARVPAATQRQVTFAMIDEAITEYLSGAEHNFHGSRDYDLLLPSGERLPPKAVFGLALGRLIGRPATPGDFSAGLTELCFKIIEGAGYPIVPKGEQVPALPTDSDDERSWAEGSKRRVLHLRRERAPGLAKMKKRRFVEEHGHLFCERCHLVPSHEFGPVGDACIEVHHRAVAIANMDASTRTRLADLQCLCANCHRIVHREQL
jgi:hypothetical protein